MLKGLNSRLLVGTTCGVLLTALAGLSTTTGADAGQASARHEAANSRHTATHEAVQGAMRSIRATGSGHATYIGKTRLSSLPDARPRDYRSSTPRSALRVPHWFKGARVGAHQQKISPSSSGAQPLVTTPTVVRLNKGGTKEAQANCGCQPPDTNGAINATRIVEAVNLTLTVYQRGGALVSRKSLASFFPTSRSISDPRVMYDNAANRWILTFIPVPETSSTTPQLYLAVSTSSDPNGSYFKYTVSFSGGLYPPGTLLDYPMLGQDANAAIISTNNFQLSSSGNFNYINSAAFAIPKSAMYSGSGFSFSAFGVAFSTHPAVARGKPIHSYPKSYLVAANSSGGFSLYYMTNTGGTPTMTLQGTTANSLWSPPPRASQPGTSTTLDALDGRLQAPPVQADSFVWFAHAVNLAGFPAVQYGALGLSTSGTNGVSATTQFAYESSTSNDWNPSIALAEPTTNQVRIFLNWAVTDPPNGQNVSLRVSGVGPGEGVPSLAGIGTTLFTGGSAPSQSRFGDFSSTTMDVKNVSASCPANTQALVVNEVFNSGSWQARLARVGTC